MAKPDNWAPRVTVLILLVILLTVVLPEVMSGRGKDLGTDNSNKPNSAAARAQKKPAGNDDDESNSGRGATLATTKAPTKRRNPTKRRPADEEDEAGRGGELPCTPKSVILQSRTSFPQLAAELYNYRRRVAPSEKTSTTPLRYVEIGALMCFNVYGFVRTFQILYPNISLEIYVVDSWGYRGPEPGLNDNNDEILGRKHFEYCRKMLDATAPGRVTLVRKKSVEGAAQFEDNFFDFVYIDALHTYNASKADMIAWYPKLRPGGLFGGDDFGDEKLSDIAPWMAGVYNAFKWGVVQAVAEFSVEYDLEFSVTSHEFKLHPKLVKYPVDPPERRLDKPYRGEPNWYIIKPNRKEYDMGCGKWVVLNGKVPL